MRTLLLVGAALTAVTAFGAIRSITPVAWNGDPNCWQMRRHFEKMNAVTNGGAKVVFIGDSITHFWESNGKDQWQKYFASGKYRALNLGTSADRTEHVLWRLTEGRELDGYEAKCVLLMIGTNNSGHFPFEKEPPVDTILGIRKILGVIREKQPKARIVLTSIFPRGRDESDSTRRRNDVVNKEICKFADGKSVIWCDFSDKFLDRQGRLSCEIFPDLLHPNARGYEIWASAVLPIVDRALTCGADDIIPSVWASQPTGFAAEGRPPTLAIRGHNYWPERYLEKRNAIVDNPSGAFDVVMVGDSITHRWERPGDGEGRHLFAKLRQTYSILNLGYGGDQTQHLLWRLQNGELEGYKAKLFTVMIGTNNWSNDPKDVAAGVRKTLDLIRAKHPESTILLYALFPRGEKPDDKARIAVGRVNELIRPLADGTHVVWLDFGAKFLDADGTLPKRLMTDFLHPNAAGYQVWHDELLPYLKKYCGK